MNSCEFVKHLGPLFEFLKLTSTFWQRVMVLERPQYNKDRGPLQMKKNIIASLTLWNLF